MSTVVLPEITLEELLARDDVPSCELVEGQLEEVHVSNLSSNVAAKLTMKVGALVDQMGIGEVFNSETYYRCFPWMENTARKPDLSFVSRERLPEDWAALGYFSIAPDLVVEVLSPNDLASKVNAKTDEYLRAQVRLVWVIDPEQRIVFVFRPDGTANTLRETEELSGENVLPGFRCRVADLFPPLASPATAPPAAPPSA